MKIVVSLMVLVLVVTASFAQTLSIDAAKIKQLDSLYQSFFKPTEPGAVVIIAQKGLPVFKKAYGMANTELGVVNNTDYKFGIGSISKQFAAVCILLLQQEGKLNIKDDIRKYLPKYNTYGKVITIENILSHTSGIPSYTESYGFDTLSKNKVPIERMVKFFESSPLIFDPGTNWSYSNSGFVLAALIIEKLSGIPYNDFLEKRIFKPLLMTETSLGTSQYTLNGKTGEYNMDSKGSLKVETQYDWYWAYGAGQIISTVNDMLKWNEALNNPSFLPAELVAMAHKEFILNSGESAHYGLGWAVGNLGNKKLIHHGGSIGGYRAIGMRIPEDQLYFLMLSNSGTTNSSLVGNKTLSLLYSIPSLKEAKTTEQQWKDIEGVYESLNAGSRLQKNFGNTPVYYSVRVDSNNRVTAQRTGGGKTALTAAGKDLLFDKNAPFIGWKVERNEKGEVSGIRFTQVFPASGPERFNKKISTILPPEIKEQKADSTTFVKYSGIYEHEFGDRISIKAVKDGLLLEDLDNGQKSKISWIEGSRFYLKDLSREFIFEVSNKGMITGYHYFNGAYNIVMKRTEALY